MDVGGRIIKKGLRMNKEYAVIYKYRPECVVCGWAGYITEDELTSKMLIREHTGKRHPWVMEVVERLELLEEVANLTFRLVTNPDDFITESDYGFFCGGCELDKVKLGHEPDCLVAELLSLKECVSAMKANADQHEQA